MIKYQADGTPEWLHQGGGTSYDFGQNVTFDQDNNPMFIGTCNQFPVTFTIDAAGKTFESSTSEAALYDQDGNFLGFVEPGIDLILAEESSGRPAIIGRENKIMACGSLLVNIPPAAIDDSVNTTENQPINIPVLNNDTDAEGDSLGVTDVTQGVNGSVTIESDSLSVTYLPNAGFMGSDNFMYTVSDGNGVQLPQRLPFS